MKPAAFTLFCALLVAPGLAAQEKPAQPAPEDPKVEDVFREAKFESWAHAGPRQDVRWKVRALSPGLSMHQRMLARLEVEISGTELAKHIGAGRLVALVQVEDEAGGQYRDYGSIELKEVTKDIRKQECIVAWEAFALPGEYRVTFGLYDEKSGEHNLAQESLRIPALGNDPLADLWQGLPRWEFFAPLTESPDTIYRPDIESRLHLKLATRSPIQVVVLADLTPTDEFYGSNQLYSYFLEAALPLIKDLSQVEVANGSLSVAALDLQRRRVTFEQDHVRTLDWARFKKVLGPDNGLGTVTVQSLQQRPTPDFLREEVLRRLPAAPEKAPALGSRASSGPPAPFRVFILVGGPMSSYAFPRFPPIPAAQAENSVVYYLQYVTPGGRGAADEVRRMLAPVAVHTFEVRTAENARQALRKILGDLGRM